jgi:hypothetical protein
MRKKMMKSSPFWIFIVIFLLVLPLFLLVFVLDESGNNLLLQAVIDMGTIGLL